ncbi:MAG: GNAT family N-acetyltransferase [Oscillospiraceae bacterium]|nr:GNAT family N-acetyltransferase [Oscillospiraceae bacterium]
MAYMTLADFSHKKELVELWVEAFGDEEGFISSFLDSYMTPRRNVPAVIDGGKLASALYLIDFPLYSNAGAIGVCAYLFAAATKKAHRNSGYMSELVGYSSELCKSRGQKAIFLFPQAQNPKLFDFYSKFGFECIYAEKKIKGMGGGGRNQSHELKDIDIANEAIFSRLYEAYAAFAGNSPLAPLKDKPFYFMCAASYLDSGARSAVLERTNEHNCEKICYVFYKKDKNTYYIDDIIPIEGKNSMEALSEFMANSKAGTNFEINVPPDSREDEKNSPLAMILPLSDDVRRIAHGLEVPAYINMFMNI